jgi:hypothetical protein
MITSLLLNIFRWLTQRVRNREYIVISYLYKCLTILAFCFKSYWGDTHASKDMVFCSNLCFRNESEHKPLTLCGLCNITILISECHIGKC